MSPYIKYLKLQIRNTKPIELLAWLVTWCFHKLLLSETFISEYMVDYFTATKITLVTIFTYYTTNYILEKYYENKILLRRKLLLFVFINLFLFTSLMILLHGYIGAYYFRDFFYPDTEDIPIDELVCISCDWTIYFGYSFLFIVITTLASISIFSEKRSAAAVLEVQKLKALQSESELQSLKNQINPHFLFNALSSIYSISYLGDKRAPDKIMQLSKMMRYVLYECNQNFVLLSNEIEYLESYIDFQKIKVEHNQSIVFDTKILNSKTQIAPMILLPLLENAFKHSAIQRVKTAYINISLNSDEKGDIHFVIKNSVPISQSQIVVDDIGGIGIENLRKRLNILYKNKYELSLLDDGTSFEVKLFLKQPKGK